MRQSTIRRVLRVARGLGPFFSLSTYADAAFPDREDDRCFSGTATTFALLVREGFLARTESEGEVFWRLTAAGQSKADEPDAADVAFDVPRAREQASVLTAPRAWTWTDPATSIYWYADDAGRTYWLDPYGNGWIPAPAPPHAHGQWVPVAATG